MLGEALKAGNLGASTPVTPAALRDALFTLHTTNAGGLISPVTFTRGQPETNDCYYVVGIKNNKFTLPYGLKDSCRADKLSSGRRWTRLAGGQSGS